MRQLNLKKYIGLCAGHCLIGSNARPVFFLNDFFLSNALVDICFEIKKKSKEGYFVIFGEEKRKEEKKKGPQGQTVLLSLTCAISKEKGCDDASNNMVERVGLTIERLYT
jgi:hypothetical protein